MAAVESIYNLIPPQQQVTPKQPLHRSQHNPTVPPTASTFLGSGNPLNVSGSASYSTDTVRVQNPTVKPYSHFGPKTQHIPNTTNFLKKTSHIDATQPVQSTFAYTDKRKPVLDHINTAYQPASTVDSGKNYIHENMLAVIMSDCKKPSSGNIDYLHKAEYGRVPAYLTDIKNTIAHEKAYIKSVLQQNAAADSQSKLKLLPEEQRVGMLQTLKATWETVHKEYQSMTHLTVLDPRKMKIKEELEQRLSSLESSIDKLSKQYVYVEEE